MDSFLSKEKLEKELRLRKMCIDKIRYNSEWDAESYGKLYNYRHKENLPYRAYFCPRCIKWHLTTHAKHETHRSNHGTHKA